MNVSDVQELHYITPIENVPSILRLGILSHRQARDVEHSSVAKPGVQKRREHVRVPGARPLHEYVNLYFHARNAMLYLRKASAEELCVLRVDPGILSGRDVVITDRNAASDGVRFDASPAGLARLEAVLVFARSWDHTDEIEKRRRKVLRCAELLVPDRVSPAMIRGTYVASESAASRLKLLCPPLATEVDPDLFFFPT